MDVVKLLKSSGIKNVKSSTLPGGVKVASFKAEKTKAEVFCLMQSQSILNCVAPKK